MDCRNVAFEGYCVFVLKLSKDSVAVRRVLDENACLKPSRKDTTVVAKLPIEMTTIIYIEKIYTP
jgi:hypothetical protein